MAQQSTTLLGGGTVLTFGDDNRVIHDGAVLIDGNCVAAIGETAALRKAHPTAEFVDVQGRTILPGIHLRPSSPLQHVGLRHRCEPRPTSSRSSSTCGGSSTARSPSTTSGCGADPDCARHPPGTTTIIDHHAAPTRSAAASTRSPTWSAGRHPRLAVLRGDRSQRPQGHRRGASRRAAPGWSACAADGTATCTAWSACMRA